MNGRTRVLFVASNPLRDQPVAVDVEARGILERIELAEARGRLDFVFVPAPRVTDLLRWNEQQRPQIVHLTGHGTAEEVFLLGADDRPTSIAVPALVRLMRQIGEDGARIVVLNYCESHDAARAIVDDAEGKIACAVGTRAAIPDRHAIAFAAAFYGAIAAGRSVARAFEEGVTQVALVGGKPDVLALCVRAGADAATLSLAPPAAAIPVAALRAPPADFTGRAKELSDVRALSGPVGVLVSGQGGVGKTALALRLAADLGRSFPDAQIDLSLRGSGSAPRTPEDVMGEVVQTFDPALKLPSHPDALARLYRSVLQGRRVLLFLDDAAGAEQIEPLLPPPGCFALVTAWTYFVVPGVAPYDLGEMTPPDAIALLRRIAARLREDEAAALAARCGYLPLALRTAAGTLAQRRDLAPARYLDRLRAPGERVKLVEQVLREGLALLAPDVREAWTQLGVLPADFDADAAAAVAGIDGDRAAEILGDILQRNLIEWDEPSGRYRFHDLARDYARQRLDGAALAAAGRRFAEHFAAIARQADAHYVKGGEAMREGLALFDRERRNIEAALAWTMERAEADATIAALLRRFVGESAHSLALRERAQDRAEWLAASIAAAKRAGDRASLPILLVNLGAALVELNSLFEASSTYEAALSIARELGDRRGEALALGGLGVARWAMDEVKLSIPCFEQQLEIARELGDRRIEADALGNLGNAAMSQKDMSRAAELYEERLASARALGDRRAEGSALGNLASARRELGRLSEAIALYDERLAIARELGDRRGEDAAIGNLGVTYHQLGELTRAIDLLERHLALSQELGDVRAEQHAVTQLAGAYAAAGEREKLAALEPHQLKLFSKLGKPKDDRSWNLGDGELPPIVPLVQLPLPAVRLDVVDDLQHER